MITVDLDDIEEAERAIERDRIVTWLRAKAKQEFEYVRSHRDRGNQGRDIEGAAAVAGALTLYAHWIEKKRHWDKPAETNEELWKQ